MKNSLKAPYNYSASFWNINFAISLWEKPKTLHFHDLGISGQVHDTQNQYYLSLESPGYLKKGGKANIISGNSFYTYQILGNRNFWKCWKRRAPLNPDGSSLNFLKSWIWYIYQKHDIKGLEKLNIGISFKRMKWTFGDMGSISSQNQ